MPVIQSSVAQPARSSARLLVFSLTALLTLTLSTQLAQAQPSQAQTQPSQAQTLASQTLAAQSSSNLPLLERRLPQVVLVPAALELPRSEAGASLGAARLGTVLVLARKGDTAASIAESYGVAPSALSPNRTGPLPVGAVIRVSLATSLATAAESESRRLPPEVGMYTVQPGDTLAGVAYRHDLSVTALLSANLNRETLDKLAVGDVLYIPARAGLLVRIKPGQTVQGLVHDYRADPAKVAQANGIGLPNELGVGDYLLLPGVLASGFQQDLMARRERQQEAVKAAQVQRQYERYQAYQQQVEAGKLKQKYAVQAQYEKYLAYQSSPERRRLIDQYEAQARYDVARQAASRAARAQASVQRSISVRAASTDSESGGLSWPLRSYQITSRFGEADIEAHRQFFHGGVDLAAPYGTPIYAAAAGTITQSGFGAFGNNVYTDTGSALIIYGHMSRTAVSVGQQVRRGQVLGYVGCSGLCTGPHLHFEVRLSGRPVNPLGLLP
jgi:murein DD-endopeptidase MepM/ murein hydrolase activator NlpD